jgi:diphthamide biosynthesis methyltransferase
MLYLIGLGLYDEKDITVRHAAPSIINIVRSAATFQ